MRAKTKKIDWDQVRAQLSRNAEAVDKALETDPMRVAEILRKRAQALARRGKDNSQELASSGRQIQTFRLSEQYYGIESDALIRIIPLASYTRVPGSAPEVLGLVNLQGDIRMVFELCLLLGLTPGQGSLPGYLLLLKNGTQPVGLRVDEMGPLQNIRPEDLESNGLGRQAENCEKGITRDRLVILDEEKISQKIRASQKTNE